MKAAVCMASLYIEQVIAQRNDMSRTPMAIVQRPSECFWSGADHADHLVRLSTCGFLL